MPDALPEGTRRYLGVVQKVEQESVEVKLTGEGRTTNNTHIAKDYFPATLKPDDQFVVLYIPAGEKFTIQVRPLPPFSEKRYAELLKKARDEIGPELPDLPPLGIDGLV